jgi:hypothetical protein
MVNFDGDICHDPRGIESAKAGDVLENVVSKPTSDIHVSQVGGVGSAGGTAVMGVAGVGAQIRVGPAQSGYHYKKSFYYSQKKPPVIDKSCG